MKIIFAGTPDISATVLQTLINSEHDVVAAYTQPDRPKGRGRQLVASPVKMLALENNIPVLQPNNLKDEQAQNEIAQFDADLMVVVAYGLILPTAVLNSPKLGCWNIHVSLLPRWRGAAPIQRAIEAGDQKTGVCIMQMDTGLDTGDILLKEVCDISTDDTAASLHDRLADLGAQSLLKALELQLNEQLKPTPQSSEGITYAEKLSKAEAWIDWTQTAQQIDQKIRAFIPFPVAQTQLQEQVIRIHQASAEAIEHNAQAGEILSADKEGVKVACGEGILSIHQLQLPGKKAMAVADILNSKAELFAVGYQMISPSSSNAG